MSDGGRLKLGIQVQMNELREVAEQTVLHGLDHEHFRPRLGEDGGARIFRPTVVGLDLVQLKMSIKEGRAICQSYTGISMFKKH